MSDNFHLQLYRGTTAQNDAYTGPAGELTVDTTLSKLRLHDGSTAGGTVIGSMPTGSIIPYAGSTAPDGYLLCDGSAISRTAYSALFAIIGTTYGEGDGNSTFNLPTSRRVITETYSSGTDWYRIYSDGWCEQGGLVASTAANVIYKTNFIKPFSKCYLMIINGTIYQNVGQANDTIGPINGLQFNWVTGRTQTQNFYWFACGYILNYISSIDIIKY